MENFIYKIEKIGIIPVVVIEDANSSIEIAKSLRKGGINCAEITFRTSAAVESIKRIAEEFPDMLIGAGTITRVDQIVQAINSGAKFIVTPGFNEKVVDYCVSNSIPIVPGCMDTYAIERAIDYGINLIKFFPAEAAGGVKMIKAFAGPYKNLKFIPTGGINASNIAQYLSLKEVVACGGSWMVKENLISNGRFDEMEKLTREAVKIVEELGEKNE